MTEQIKAIETRYNGYKFRSRLEARWAVFFDELGIKYEYEPEGYTMKDGTKYLPDFYLPEEGYYIECKGYSDHVFWDLERITKFVLEAKTAVMILSEVPYDPGAYGLFLFPILYYEARSNGRISGHYAFFKGCDGHRPFYIEDDFAIGMQRWFYFKKPSGPLEDIDQNQFAYNEIQAVSGRTVESGDGYGVREAFDFSKIENALLKARQARFEHGECG